MDFIAQPLLGPDAETVADDQHANQQLSVNRRTAGMAVERGEMLAQLAQVKKLIHAA